MINIEDINATYRQLTFDDESEEQFRNIYNYFRLKDPSLEFTPAVRTGSSDGCKSFIATNGQFFWGLKDKIIKYLEQNKISYIDNTKDIKETLDDEEFDQFIEKLDLPFPPRFFQMDGARLSLEQKRIVILSATGSGKSLIIYILFRWFIYKGLKTLLVVPDVGLKNQMYSDMIEYYTALEDTIKKEINEAYDDKTKFIANKKLKTLEQNRIDLGLNKPLQETIKVIESGKDKSLGDVSIVNFQSLHDLGPTGYYDDVDVLIYDEAHRNSANSYININKYTTNALYKLGLTGTLPPNTIEQLILEGAVGPAKRVVSAKQLIEMGLATKVSIQPILLEYDKETNKNVKKMKYHEQTKFFKELDKKKDFLYTFALKLKNNGNSIFLFKNVDIQKELYKRLKEVHKNTFLINGAIKASDRENIRQALGEFNDAILIGSDKILSTGLNIPSLKYLVFGQSGKAEISTIQSLGRLMRLHKGKDESIVYDIVDSARHVTRGGNYNDNYAWKHFKERVNSYIKFEFPINEPIKIKFNLNEQVL